MHSIYLGYTLNSRQNYVKLAVNALNLCKIYVDITLVQRIQCLSYIKLRFLALTPWPGLGAKTFGNVLNCEKFSTRAI